MLARFTHALSQIVTLLALAFLTGSCQGPQSALDPAGYEARRLAELFWVMCGGAIAIWIAVMALALYAVRRNDPPSSAANLLILGGGVGFSVAVLTILLIYGLTLMGTLRNVAGV